MDKLIIGLGALTGSIVFILFISFLLSAPVWLLWNYCLVGAVVGINQITWLQAWGISILFKILFKASITTKSKD